MRTTAPAISSSIPAPSAARSGDRIGDGTDGRADAAGIVAGTKVIGVGSCAASRVRRVSAPTEHLLGRHPMAARYGRDDGPRHEGLLEDRCLGIRRPNPPPAAARDHLQAARLKSMLKSRHKPIPASNHGHQHHASPRMTVGGFGRTLTNHRCRVPAVRALPARGRHRTRRSRVSGLTGMPRRPARRAPASPPSARPRWCWMSPRR